MSEKENNEERLPELSETERYEMEQMMIEMAFENSYRVITEKTTFNKLLRTTSKDKYGRKAILIYDPELGWDNKVLEDLIDYFEEEEEYEKCAELKKLLNV